MSDLIDRQDAIGALEKAKKTYYDRVVVICRMQDNIKQLPSAQPERMCYGCRYERHGSVVCDSCSRFFLDRYEVEHE